MDEVKLAAIIPSYQAKTVEILERLQNISNRMILLEQKKYRAAAIMDQIVFQIGESTTGDELYSALEIDFNDTVPVFY
jgi:hypothetical protein